MTPSPTEPWLIEALKAADAHVPDDVGIILITGQMLSSDSQVCYVSTIQRKSALALLTKFLPALAAYVAMDEANAKGADAITPSQASASFGGQNPDLN